MKNSRDLNFKVCQGVSVNPPDGPTYASGDGISCSYSRSTECTFRANEFSEECSSSWTSLDTVNTVTDYQL